MLNPGDTLIWATLCRKGKSKQSCKVFVYPDCIAPWVTDNARLAVAGASRSLSTRSAMNGHSALTTVECSQPECARNTYRPPACGRCPRCSMRWSETRKNGITVMLSRLTSGHSCWATGPAQLCAMWILCSLNFGHYKGLNTE